MKQLLIVAHAPSPHTLSLLEAVKRGAIGFEDVSVTALSPFATEPKHVRSTNGIILGTTENLGYMSGALKDFFDRIYYPCLEETQGMPYALYVRARHDGTGTRRGVETIVTGLRWRAVREPLICRGDFRDHFLRECEELGALMAAGLDAGIF